MFEIGATYDRRIDIHARFGGQRQGGIATPVNCEFIFIFTGAAGQKHGYRDEFTDDGFHLYGEGQVGSMVFKRGNLALRDHAKNGKRLLLFQSLGKSKRCVYRGEYRLTSHYRQDQVPDTNGDPRSAIIFILQRTRPDAFAVDARAGRELEFSAIHLSDTSKHALAHVRTKQVLFRDRLELVERGCRITGITDGRFLRASHIKPWSHCEDGHERTDGHNGLLLAHHVDHLFDQGWLTFDASGISIYSEHLPTAVVQALGLKAKMPPRFPQFNDQQIDYLKYHRAIIFKGT